MTRGTVTKWRNRFAVDRFDGLLDEPRPGRPRVVGDDRIEALIAATLETTPPDATHWSTRSMWTKTADQILESVANYCK